MILFHKLTQKRQYLKHMAISIFVWTGGTVHGIHHGGFLYGGLSYIEYIVSQSVFFSSTALGSTISHVLPQHLKAGLQLNHEYGSTSPLTHSAPHARPRRIATAALPHHGAPHFSAAVCTATYITTGDWHNQPNTGDYASASRQKVHPAEERPWKTLGAVCETP